MKNTFDKELHFYASRIRSLSKEKKKWTANSLDLFHACHTLKGLCLAANLNEEAKTLHEVEECMIEKDEKQFLKAQSVFLTTVEQLFHRNGQEVEVDEFLEEYVSRISKQIGKNVCLKFIDKSTDFLVDFGEYHFKKLMIHLLMNAVYHGIETPRERNLSNKCSIGTILVEIKGDEENYYLSVSDDGRGFGNSEQTSANLFAGRNQGLLIVEQLIKEHQGDLEVITDSNFGSTIVCKVPTVSFGKEEKQSA